MDALGHRARALHAAFVLLASAGCGDGGPEYRVETVASDLAFPCELSPAGEVLYVVACGGWDGARQHHAGAILTVPLQGGAPTTLVRDEMSDATDFNRQWSISSFERDDEYLYWLWTPPYFAASRDGYLMRADLLGSGATMLATVSWARDVVSSGDLLFVVATDETTMETVLFSIPKAGGALTEMHRRDGIGTLDADAAGIVFDDRGMVFSLAAGETEPSVLVGGLFGQSRALTLDGSEVWYSDYESPPPNDGESPDDGFVARVARDGESPEILVTRLQSVRHLRLDESALYFTIAQDRSIKTVPRSGGDVKTIATDRGIGDLAIHRGVVYWTTLDGEVVGRVRSAVLLE